MGNFALRPPFPLERTPVTIKQEVVCATESVRTFGEEKILVPLPEFESRNFQLVQTI
jgi:hypothetical protein